MNSLINKEDIVSALNTYGIFYRHTSQLYNYYYVAVNSFSNEQFKQGIIDLLLLKGEKYYWIQSSPSFRNLSIISTIKPLVSYL